MDEIAMIAELRPEPPRDLASDSARRRLIEEINTAPRPARAPRRRRNLRLAAAAGVAAAVAGAVVLPGGTGGSLMGTAWAVERTQDGAVKVSITREFKDPAGLQRGLREDGVNAVVQLDPELRPKTGYDRLACGVPSPRDLASPAVQRAVVAGWRGTMGLSGSPTGTLPGLSWTIRPAAMPPGAMLLIQVGIPSGTRGDGMVASPVVLRDHKLPRCTR